MTGLSAGTRGVLTTNFRHLSVVTTAEDSYAVVAVIIAQLLTMLTVLTAAYARIYCGVGHWHTLSRKLHVPSIPGGKTARRARICRCDQTYPAYYNQTHQASA